jgi:hypothetical protein
MHSFTPFTDEQRRLQSNLDQYYRAWVEALREDAELPRLHWKRVGEREYLYRTLDSRGNAKSMGARSEITEQIYEQAKSGRRENEARRAQTKARLDETCALYRATRALRGLAPRAAAILQALDVAGDIGSKFLVVGTNAMPAYELEADRQIVIQGGDVTDDFDVAWMARNLEVLGDDKATLLERLRRFDSSFKVSSKQPYQLIDASGYEVELLAGPEVIEVLQSSGESLRPLPLEEQNWLLWGRMVDRVVIGMDRTPARIVAPDPRWMALHKLWLSEQAKRNVQKRPKDRVQGIALLDAIERFMPHYPLDQAFERELPIELDDVLKRWRAGMVRDDNFLEGGLIESAAPKRSSTYHP